MKKASKALPELSPIMAKGAVVCLRELLDRSCVSNVTRSNSLMLNAQAQSNTMYGVGEATATALAAENITTVGHLDALARGVIEKRGGKSVFADMPGLLKALRSELAEVGIALRWVNRVAVILCARYLLRNYPTLFDVTQFL